MKLLLDTHLLLWAAAGAGLPSKAEKLIADPEVELLFSAASIWEIAIKSALAKPDFNVDASVFRRELLEAGYRELVITGAHAAAVATLPELHKDPFDRMLVAQATIEGVALLTADKAVMQYPGPIETAL